MKEAKYLQRDGMAPLSQHFERAYREYCDYESARGDGGKHPLAGMDAGDFCAELHHVGLGDTRKLAEVLGVSERMAQVVKADPARLTKERHSMLCAWLDNEEMRLEYRLLDCMDSTCPRDAEEAGKERDAFVHHADALRDSAPLVSLREALREESELRFLVEAFEALRPADRHAVVRMLVGLLSRTRTPTARFLAQKMDERPTNLTRRLDWLSGIICADTEELERTRHIDGCEDTALGAASLFSQCVLDEYTGRSE